MIAKHVVSMDKRQLSPATKAEMLQGWLLPTFEPGVKSSGSFEARAYAGEDLKVAIARDLTPQKSAETTTGACSVASALSAGRCSNGFHCLGSEKAQPLRSSAAMGAAAMGAPPCRHAKRCLSFTPDPGQEGKDGLTELTESLDRPPSCSFLLQYVRAYFQKHRGLGLCVHVCGSVCICMWVHMKARGQAWVSFSGTPFTLF